VTPNSLVAGAAVVGWRGPSTSLVGASFRLAFLRAATDELRVPGGSASFTWTVGRVDGCGLLRPKTPLRVGLCARLEAGVLDVSGVGDAGANTQHSPWLALIPLAHAEWSILGSLFLDLDVGPSLRAVTNRFYFLPDTTAYTVPLVGLETEAGLAIHFL
jgi:hypothetical protein